MSLLDDGISIHTPLRFLEGSRTNVFYIPREVKQLLADTMILKIPHTMVYFRPKIRTPVTVNVVLGTFLLSLEDRLPLDIVLRLSSNQSSKLPSNFV